MEQTGSSMKARLDLLASVALIVAALVVIWMAVRRPPEPPPLVVTWPPAEASIGAASAGLGIMMFSDFECPYCTAFSTETLPGLLDSYVRQGKARLAFRHLPLPIHRNAQTAARWAVCAGQQGRFWQAHDVLFGHSSSLGSLDLTTFGARAGLSQGLLLGCAASEESDRLIQMDLAEARRLEIRATPTFLFGRLDTEGRLVVSDRFSGAAPLERFLTVLQSLD